jgi:linoleate 10R-lipoxygenase
MPSMEKYQTGEDYGDVEKDHATIFSDPRKIAQNLLKDFTSVLGDTSLWELQPLIEQLFQKGQPLDDKKGSVDVHLSRVHGRDQENGLGSETRYRNV